MSSITPNKFSIIVPVYKTEQFLDKCFDAIDDQDYKHKEVIVVVNQNNLDVIKKARKRKYHVVTVDEDKGAPYARNQGVSAASGDYLLFVDSDTYLNPGILTVYAEALRDHPECDFVYTGYEIVTNPGDQPQIIAARPFDYYRLTCNNYISGTNPMRREVFPGWDEDMTSLQDWDMWLTICGKGSKGFFIADFIGFKTEPVRGTSVSYDSYKHWIDRRTKVRTKHGIEDRDIAVISMGAPQHGLATAKILNADFYDHPIHKENNYKLVYLIGFYPGAAKDHIAALRQNVAEDAKRIVHWIGTDVYQLMHQVSWAGMHDMKKIFEQLKVVHWTEYQMTHDEMAEMGFETTIVPLPPEKIYEPVALPDEFSVGVYINDTQNMYYEDHMYDIARAMPDIKFKFFGSKVKKDHTEDNMEWVGYVDMDEFINNTSCILRMTVHDGLPIGPVQFFMKGRNVVTNTPMAYAYQITEKDGQKVKSQIINSIREIKEKGGVNMEASKFYQELMDHNKFKEAVYGQK